MFGVGPFVLAFLGVRLRIPAFLGDVAFELTSCWIGTRIKGDPVTFFLNGDKLADRVDETGSSSSSLLEKQYIMFVVGSLGFPVFGERLRFPAFVEDNASGLAFTVHLYTVQRNRIVNFKSRGDVWFPFVRCRARRTVSLKLKR
jgi:hypothetical protein